jgi:4-hydroxymandelate oxidase
MMPHSSSSLAERRRQHRREFLRFLAGSPCIAGVAAAGKALAWQSAETPYVISNPKEALNVLEFEEAARRKVLPPHWAYMVSGVDDDATLRANREGFKHVELRPRRLEDATKIDMHVELFGRRYDSPIFVCPTGGQKSYHPEGEVAVARAANTRNSLMILSTATSTGVEEVAQALGRPPWYQLYAPTSWDACEKILRRVEAAGCPVVALTVDNTTGRNSETFKRLRRSMTLQCTSCHGPEGPTIKERKMYDGIDMTGIGSQNPSMTWDFVDKLRQATSMKLIIKGIDTHEDARLCLEHGIDGILVSNHGGRSTETGRATIEALPEIVAEVGGRIPVLVDGGFRRGTDVFKALALGARGVGIGRPYLWGLGAFGQPGVDRVLEILNAELKLTMGNCGTHTVAQITRERVATPDWRI